MKGLYVHFALGLLILLAAAGVNAQAQPPQSWTPLCLDFSHCSGANGSINANCPPLSSVNPEADRIHTSSHWGHRAQIDLRGITIPPNQRVVIMECVQPHIYFQKYDPDGDGNNDWICTTGYSESDISFRCPLGNDSPSCDARTLMKNAFQYGFEGETFTYNYPEPWIQSPRTTTLSSSYNIFYKANANINDVTDPYVKATAPLQISSDNTGKLNVSFLEWQGFTPYPSLRNYVLFYTAETAFQSIVPDREPVGRGGQQQDTLTFTFKPTVLPAQKDCPFNEAWDPYGKVFDMATLEPISMASVLLLQKDEQGQFTSTHTNSRHPALINPFFSGSKGDFSFYVEDGDYKLTPTKEGYTHPTQSAFEPYRAAAAQIYSDFYLADSTPILQRGAIQHRDIPLASTGGTTTSSKLLIVLQDWEVTANGSLKYEGEVSHPFAQAIIETCKLNNGVEVCSKRDMYDSTKGGPDKEGKFSFTIDQKLLAPGEYYRASFRKVDLLTRQPKEDEVSLSDSVTIQPVMSYIEGFAFDTTGNLLKGGFVGLYQKHMPQPVYIAPISETGFFRITSEYIPDSPYEIKYLKQNGTSYAVVTSLTSSQFLDQNKEFIISEEINPYLNTTDAANPRRNVTPSFVPQAHISPVATTISPTPAPETSPNQTGTSSPVSRNPVFLVGAILLLLLGGAGVLLAVYVYRKRSREVI